jgi:hypothetical protein
VKSIGLCVLTSLVLLSGCARDPENRELLPGDRVSAIFIVAKLANKQWAETDDNLILRIANRNDFLNQPQTLVGAPVLYQEDFNGGGGPIGSEKEYYFQISPRDLTVGQIANGYVSIEILGPNAWMTENVELRVRRMWTSEKKPMLGQPGSRVYSTQLSDDNSKPEWFLYPAQ